MNRLSFDTITADHKMWKLKIIEWREELNRLHIMVSDLAANNPREKQKPKLEKYSNHILHNQRLIEELSGTIKTHELFLEEFSEMGTDAPIDDFGHKKNQEHFKLFEDKFNKLCKKVNKLVDKS